jgi:hypothetical protein
MAEEWTAAVGHLCGGISANAAVDDPPDKGPQWVAQQS